MGSFSIWHWLVILVIVMLVFGAGKIPRLMGDMAKGVKAFKSGLKDDDEAPGDQANAAPTVIPAQPPEKPKEAAMAGAGEKKVSNG